MGAFTSRLPTFACHGGQQADHERAAQDFEVAANRVIGDAERSTELREVEGLTVVVAHHYPESTQGLRGNGDPEGGDVAFEVAADEVFPPEGGGRVVIGEIASREPSPKPQPAPFSGAGLVYEQGAEVVVRDPAGKALGDLLHQIRRGTPEQQVSGGRLAVRKDAEERKEIGLALHLVDHDGAVQALQGGLRLVQAGEAPRVLEVEEVLRLQ